MYRIRKQLIHEQTHVILINGLVEVLFNVQVRLTHQVLVKSDPVPTGDTIYVKWVRLGINNSFVEQVLL